HFSHNILSGPPSDLHSAAALINRSNRQPRQAAVIKLIFQSIIYALWRERNARVFTAASTNAPGLRRVLDRQIRDRLISFPSPDSSPSMLEFYFSCIRPP
ncbi:hypothetical protein N665_0866s0006, partial [Sinapis alba]